MFGLFTKEKCVELGPRCFYSPYLCDNSGTSIMIIRARVSSTIFFLKLNEHYCPVADFQDFLDGIRCLSWIFL